MALWLLVPAPNLNVAKSSTDTTPPPHLTGTGPLVQKLISAAEAEEQLLDLLAGAVNRGNRDDVFLVATQLTKTFLTDSKHRAQPK